MVTVHRSSFTQVVPVEALPEPQTLARVFPQDLTAWVPVQNLLGLVQEAAERASGTSWLALLQGFQAPAPQEDLLVLLAYCYLRGVYPSLDVVRQLDSDETLAAMRPRFGLRPEQVRQFRKERRSAITDTLTCALVQVWRLQNPHLSDVLFSDSLVRNRHNFGLLEPFHLHARERLDRAVILDSMALNY